ncbi:MAG: hypothetical protein AAF298_18335, partial [Cyanobacteria bacterium P01_A01_bin.40]
MIGYALDGFPMYANLDKEGKEASNLDQCRGVYDEEVRGYHYRVADAGSNSFINCFKGESGCKFEGDGDGQMCDATATGDRSVPPPDGRPRDGMEGAPPDFEELPIN